MAVLYIKSHKCELVDHIDFEKAYDSSTGKEKIVVGRSRYKCDGLAGFIGVTDY